MRLNEETQTSSQTKMIGKGLGSEISQSTPKEGAIVFGLRGELGGGKTTFVQGFASGLGIKEKILSPTFIIIRNFKLKNSNFFNFYHIDAYRLRSSKELLDLDFKNIINNPRNIVIIEWADKIRKILPKTTVWINFKFINESKRKIILE